MKQATGRNAADYRPDIDGLRALAIVAVLLFHFDLLGAGGGFVGVDIFFVLSGYLMTSMLARQGAAARRIGEFYRRRFWRIAPAYFVTLAATLLIGLLVMLPADIERLGVSAIASTLLVSNFFFSSGAGYFDTASIYKPLLHTWSLAVEAQFYLVWPLVMTGVLWLRPAWRLWALLILLATSIIACQFLAIADPKVAFFSLPTRLWQFAAGAIVGVDTRIIKLLRGRRIAPALQWAALATIVATPWLVREGDLWPTPGAAPACLAAALLIALGGEGQCGRLLALPPLVYTGRISYSLYLVHWPVVVYAGYGQFPQAPLWLRFTALVLCIPLAMLLYRWVEAPMRIYGRAPASLKSKSASEGRAPAAAARALGGFAALALATIALGTLAHRLPDQLALRTAPAVAPVPLNAFACTPWRASTGATFCKIGDPAAQPHSLLWGDSHGMHFAQGLALRLQREGGSVLVSLKDACPPVTGVWRVSNALVKREDCPLANSQTLALALGEAQITSVIIAARWAYYVETTRFGAEKGGRAYVISSLAPERSVANSRRVLEENLAADVRALNTVGKSVLLIAQAPELGFDGARCVRMRMLAQGKVEGCDVAASIVAARQAAADAMLARVVSRASDARVIDPRAVLCDADVCHGVLNGAPAYRDDNHLTGEAAAQVLEDLLPGLR